MYKTPNKIKYVCMYVWLAIIWLKISDDIKDLSEAMNKSPGPNDVTKMRPGC